MAMFGSAQGKVPVDQQVATLRSQGMADDQIMMTLQQQGYDPQEIQYTMGYGAPQQMPGQMPQQPAEQMPPPYPDQGGMDMGSLPEEKIEEIAEAIIDEKWNALAKEMTKVVEWKDKLESRFVKLEQEITDVKERFEALHGGILGKVNEYDQHIKDVGVEIKAMEKVFQKILPTFTENVNKLERIAKK